VIAAEPSLLETVHPDKLLPSSEAVPERFELGTLPYELMAGTTAAVDFLAGLSGIAGDRRSRLLAAMAAVQEHEDALRHALERRLGEINGVVLHGRAARRTPTLLLTFREHDPLVVAAHLASLGVNAPAGSFYALEASRRLGLGDAGGLRIGIAPYTDTEDVDRLVAALADALDQPATSE
jgi:selenocysteine lyase/cysteine desulfurase